MKRLCYLSSMDDFNYFISEVSNIYSYLPEDKFKNITDIKKSAVSRFGNDPEVFKTEFKNYKIHSINCLKKTMETLSTETIMYNIPYYISHLTSMYQNYLVAIFQVDFECPGFIKNFKEAINYKISADNIDISSLLHKQSEHFNKIIENYNRYSKKFDFKYLISAFNITEEDLKNQDQSSRYNIRVDDWVAINFAKLLNTTKNSKDISYLKTNFSTNRDLLPQDYKNILSVIMEEEFSNLHYVNKSLKWIDYYFDNQDELLKNLKYSRLVPDIIKMINYTLIT